MSMTAGQRWSQDKPVKPGWYWWRLNEESDVEMVMVFTQGTYLLARLYGYTPEKKAIKLSKTGGEWCGPLVPPADITPNEEAG